MAEAITQSLKDNVIEDEEELLFEQLQILYTTNPTITREFALSLCQRIFDQIEREDEKTPGIGINAGRLSKSEFLRIMKLPGPLKYILVQPSVIRGQFTEFVIRNRDLAMEIPDSMIGLGGELPMD